MNMKMCATSDVAKEWNSINWNKANAYVKKLQMRLGTPIFIAGDEDFPHGIMFFPKGRALCRLFCIAHDDRPPFFVFVLPLYHIPQALP